MFSRLKTEYFDALIGGFDINRDKSVEKKIRIRIIVVAKWKRLT
jgi:hypothetical protein